VTAKGVYRELLDAQWELGGLPADPAELQRLIGATHAEWKNWNRLIERKFPIAADGVRRNPRLEEHRSKAAAKRKANQEGAAKTNAKRWGRNVVQFPQSMVRDEH
jgi:uncharacterized protein YdaU (DUF1376 family)